MSNIHQRVASSQEVTTEGTCLAIYLIAVCRGRSRLRKIVNALMLHLLLRQAIAQIRKVLNYRSTIYVITDMPLILTGLRDVQAILPLDVMPLRKGSRWAPTYYKWEIENFCDRYEYLLYIDCDLLVMKSDFLERFLDAPVDIMLMKAANRSEYSHVLLPQEFAGRDMFDPSCILGRSAFMKRIFAHCKELKMSNTGVFNRYGDMPFMNRAVVDLGVDLEKTCLADGITWAQHTTDYAQSLYHFNSGSLFEKWWRTRRFLRAMAKSNVESSSV